LHKIDWRIISIIPIFLNGLGISGYHSNDGFNQMTELEYIDFYQLKLIDKPKLIIPKIATWGTFDCLHDGHKEFLLKASQLGKLFVIVVPSFAKIFNKEYKPRKSAFDRKADLIQFGKAHDNIIENVLIDCYQFGLKSLILLKPDIFVFGYDQKAIWDKLLPQFLNYFGLNTKFLRFHKTNALKHNGQNGNFSLDLGDYQSLLKQKQTFFKKSNSIDYPTPHSMSLINSESKIKHLDEIR